MTVVSNDAHPRRTGTNRVPAGTGALWRRLADDLRRRVGSGEFADGFPGEMALASEYAVSRHTVREALRGLRRDGIVTAARGRASRVAAGAEGTLIEQPTSSLYSLFASVRQTGLAQRSAVRRREVVTDAAVASALGLHESTPLTHLERIRFAGDCPLAFDRVWLPAARTPGLLDADFGNTSLYGQLREVCGIVMTGGRERVTARIPDAETRRVLDIASDVAVLVVDRVGLSGDDPVEWRETVFRGDLFSMTTQYPAAGDDRTREQERSHHDR